MLSTKLQLLNNTNSFVASQALWQKLVTDGLYIVHFK